MGTSENLMTSLGVSYPKDRVYIDPPENTHIVYPCFVVQRENASVIHAGNGPYTINVKYQVTYMTEDGREAEARCLDMLYKYQYCAHERSFVNDQIHHEVFTIYC